jgi:hypothetical protein
MTRNNYRKVGEFSVDSGQVWIGDPCYLDPESFSVSPKAHSPSSNTKAFAAWADTTRKPNGEPVQHPLGILSSTGYGDGTYAVYAKMITDRHFGERVGELRIVFVDGD